MLNTEKLYQFIDKQWQEEILPSLCDYIKIPNKSPHFDPKWEENGYMEEAVSHIAKWCKKHAPNHTTIDIIRLEKRTPLLCIEVAGDAHETTLFYGHLDKQPEMSGWNEGLAPWTPVLKDGKLYGRGSADDGYSVYACLTAINALQNQNIPHGRCVILIEACEESGSYDLPYYIELLKKRIGKPNLIVCLDSGAGNYEQLWMTTSLRGHVAGKLTVELLTEGVHSGDCSGIIADSFRVARALLERVEDQHTGDIKLSNLYCTIPPARINQAADCASALGEEVYQAFPLQQGVKPVTTNVQELILNRTWRPALTITGAEGLPPIENAGNVLRPKTAFKISLRIPPLVNAKKAAETLENTLLNSPPYGSKVTFELEEYATGWEAPTLSQWFSTAVSEASTVFFNKPAMYMGEGGSIPFMGMLGKSFPDAQFMITGVLGPHSNAHGPNEFLHLDMVKKLTSCVAYILHKHFKTLAKTDK